MAFKLLLLFIACLSTISSIEAVIKGCNTVMNSSTGSFHSPGYPVGYPNSLSCTIWIVVPRDKRIALTVHGYSIEGCCDYLEIFDAGKKIAKLAGHLLTDVRFVSNTNQMKTILISDARVSNRGFSASYYTFPAPGWPRTGPYVDVADTLTATHLSISIVDFSPKPRNSSFRHLACGFMPKRTGYTMAEFAVYNPMLRKLEAVSRMPTAFIGRVDITGNLSLTVSPVRVSDIDGMFLCKLTYTNDSYPREIESKIIRVPDSCKNYTVFSGPNRAFNNTIFPLAGCDRSLPANWYRFIGQAGDRLLDYCPPNDGVQYRCGTQGNGWLNGPYPRVEDDVVTRQFCVAHYRYPFIGCCIYQNNIQVRNCGEYFVYFLVPLCPSRYCGYFGGNYSSSSLAESSSTIMPSSSLSISLNVSFSPTVMLSPTLAPTPSSPSAPSAMLSTSPPEPSSADIMQASSTPAKVIPTTPSLDGCKNYQVLSDHNRLNTYSDGSNTRCDNNLRGWYRFMGDAGNRMASTCPGIYGRSRNYCGAFWQGWLNTSHPNEYDGEVYRTVCFSRSFNCSCEDPKYIKVRNCGHYFVYKLEGVPKCNQRYCGAKDNTICTIIGSCHPNGTCVNVNGTHGCQCNSGFSGNGKNCSDIDECAASNQCHHNATCQNTLGSFICTCNSGFSGNGTHCVDINECLNNPCHSNATCSNSIGSYKCTCKISYLGNGAKCTYIVATVSVNPTTIRPMATASATAKGTSKLPSTTITTTTKPKTTTKAIVWGWNNAGVLQPLKFLVTLAFVFSML